MSANPQTNPSDWPDLSEKHRQQLIDSGIDPAIAQDRGYRTITAKAQLHSLGFTVRQSRAPTFLMPVHNVHGEIGSYQARPDLPRIEKGKAIKYETPRNTRMLLDVPPSVRPLLGDPKRPLFITEGIKKADSGATHGLCVIGLLGVWNWRGRNERGGAVVLADFESIALNQRTVYIAFDSDVMTKLQVLHALIRLKAFLESRHADVKMIYLPSGEGGSKVGLDDYFVAGNCVDDLLRLATSELRLPDDFQEGSALYERTDHGLVWNKPTDDGTTQIPLSNFTATITANIVEDDGADMRNLYEIEAICGTRTATALIPAAQFSSMIWVHDALGATAILYAGFAIRDHTRCAIQMLSDNPPERRIYTHTGWREIDGRWVFLHAGGGIGAGDISVEVRLPDGLEAFCFPEPASGPELKAAVRSSLRMLDVAPDQITVPVYCSVFRAPLGSVDMSTHVAGTTGKGKSELEALAQQHFGRSMVRQKLPGNWSSTANANEVLAFHAKDCLLVIDEFVPEGGVANTSRLNRDAARLFRAQGNQGGRRRLRSDGSLRPPMAPRGLIISSGEDTPRGQSVLARIFLVEMDTALDWERLTKCQQDGASGQYDSAMASFLNWLAPHYKEVQSQLSAEVRRLRERLDRVGHMGHRRTPEMTAQLLVGACLFLRFATESDSITIQEADALHERFVRALLEVAAKQADHQSQANPATRFLTLLNAALVAGVAHVADIDGNAPPEPRRWGWRHERGTYCSVGSCVGWVDEEKLYLDPDASYRAVQQFGRDGNQELSISLQALHRQLHEQKLLVRTDNRAGRVRYKVRRMIQGSRRHVLCINADSLLSQEVAHVAHDPDQAVEVVGTWATAWATVFPVVAQPVAHEEAPHPAKSTTTTPDGPPGPPTGQILGEDQEQQADASPDQTKDDGWENP